MMKYLLLITTLLFIGCSTKCDPEVIKQVEYKETVKAVKCQVTIPEKPVYDEKDITSFDKLMDYYDNIETMLKGCVQ